MNLKRPITERALLQRIRRALAKDGKTIKAARSQAEAQTLGAFYIVDNQNTIAATVPDLETYARQMRVLEPWETLGE